MADLNPPLPGEPPTAGGGVPRDRPTTTPTTKEFGEGMRCSSSTTPSTGSISNNQRVSPHAPSSANGGGGDRSKAPAAPHENDGHLIDISPVMRESPPWLISAVIHILLLVLFGLLVAKQASDLRLELNVGYSEDLGEQLIEESLDLAADSQFDLEEQLITPDDLPVVEDPLAAPAITEIAPVPTNTTTLVVPTAIGMALTGRTTGTKQALLQMYGGNASTEAAVLLGLEWLKRQQRTDGMWSLKGPYTDGTTQAENMDAATAMALLAFLGAGHTHQSEPSNPFQRVVDKGIEALLYRQQGDGSFFQQGPNHHRFYTNAQCTIVLCELYGMTGDHSLRTPAQNAVDYLVDTQTPQGGWRYDPAVDNDLSVTGWVVMALQSARMAGLEVRSETLDRVSKFLDMVAKDDGRQYAYRPRDGATLPMTAEGLLCRQYLGWQHDDPRLRAGADLIVENLPVWQNRQRNVYYWYYATQVCHHMGGSWWQTWNGVTRELLPANQESRGRERGSWDPQGDRRRAEGGRLYVTCLSIYILEVYYRHLPIYQSGLLEP